MNALIDLVPVLLFFGAYLLYDLYVATAVLIAASWAVVAWHWYRRGSLPRMPLATAALISVLGGLTLWLHDPAFVKMKPTAVFAAISLALLGSHFIGSKVLLARLPQQVVVMPDAVWRRVNAAWAVYYALLAGVNWYIAHHYSDSVWATWKFLSFTVLPFGFLMLHTPFISQYFVTDPAKDHAR